MAKIILRANNQDDLATNVPDYLLDGRPLYFPEHQEVSVDLPDENPATQLPLQKIRFDYLGIEERGKDSIMVYVMEANNAKQ